MAEGTAKPASALSGRHVALLAGLVVGVAALVWLTWPGHLLRRRADHGLLSLVTGSLPAMTIRVTEGGHAMQVTDDSIVALPDTVRLSGGVPAVLRIENTDTVAHRLGMFGVPAHAVREYTISHAGTYAGYCSAHPGHRLTYIVQ